MKISEIFKSIDGEGITAGFPAVFIRTYGCNLRCSYCDSLYALEGDDYVDMSVDDIIDIINTQYPGSKHATVTGGEPLIQEDLPSLLVRLIMETSIEFINIETNGAVRLPDFMLQCRKYKDEKIDSKIVIEDRIIFTMDWKSISSGMDKAMLEENLPWLGENDVLKFVVGSKEDLDQMYDVVKRHPIDAHIFVSPVFGKIEPAEIVQYLLDNHLDFIRMQLQMHKFIWDPNKRGV